MIMGDRIPAGRKTRQAPGRLRRIANHEMGPALTLIVVAALWALGVFGMNALTGKLSPDTAGGLFLLGTISSWCCCCLKVTRR
jgi:hypothetical protein